MQCWLVWSNERRKERSVSAGVTSKNAMKTIKVSLIVAAMMAVVVAVAGPAQAAEPIARGYRTGFDTVVHLSSDLHRALEGKARAELQPTPILLEHPGTPWVQIRAATNASWPRAVYISSGLISLLNYVSHAKAIDAVDRGFLAKAIAKLSLEAGGPNWPSLPAGTIRDPWSSDVMNRQASHFNQMAGALVAIQMTHVTLGHYQKYGPELIANSTESLPINRVITSAEWRKAVRQSVHLALACGLAIEGLTVLFEGLDQLPTRPSWRIYFAPEDVDLGKMAKELYRVQQRDMFSSRQPASDDEFQVRGSGDQALLVSTMQEAPDGFPALFTVIQSPMVDVHSHEFVRQLPAHIAGELEGVPYRFGAMFQAIANARGQNSGDDAAVGR